MKKWLFCGLLLFLSLRLTFPVQANALAAEEGRNETEEKENETEERLGFRIFCRYEKRGISNMEFSIYYGGEGMEEEKDTGNWIFLRRVTTDSLGKAEVFEDKQGNSLLPGTYKIEGTPLVRGSKRYEAAKIAFSLPFRSPVDGTVMEVGEIYPKISAEQIENWLPQTGQDWKIVLFCGAAGVVSLVSGVIFCTKQRKKE